MFDTKQRKRKSRKIGGSPGKLASIVLFLAFEGISNPDYWNQFKSNFEKVKDNHELIYIVHSPDGECPHGWIHVNELDMVYNEHTSWCGAGLPITQLECYYHIIQNYGDKIGTIYFVSGDCIPCAPPNILKQSTFSQINHDGCTGTECENEPATNWNLQWQSFTINTVKQILDVALSPLQLVLTKYKNALDIIAQHSSIIHSFSLIPIMKYIP